MVESHDILFELYQKIAKTARPRHPAQLPSSEDLKMFGTDTFIRELGTDVPVCEIVFHAFRSLDVGRHEALAEYVKDQAKKFGKTALSDIEVDGNSSLHQVFEDFLIIADEANVQGAQEILGRAERFGWYVVERAQEAVEAVA